MFARENIDITVCTSSQSHTVSQTDHKCDSETEQCHATHSQSDSNSTVTAAAEAVYNIPDNVLRYMMAYDMSLVPHTNGHVLVCIDDQYDGDSDATVYELSMQHSPRALTEHGYDRGEVRAPKSACVSTDGKEIFVASGAQHNISVFSHDTGEFLRCFGKRGTEPGCIISPLSIDMSPCGSIVIADTINDRVQVLDSQTGAHIRTIAPIVSGNSLRSPYFIQVDRRHGRVFILDRTIGLCVCRVVDGSLLTVLDLLSLSDLANSNNSSSSSSSSGGSSYFANLSVSDDGEYVVLCNCSKQLLVLRAADLSFVRKISLDHLLADDVLFVRILRHDTIVALVFGAIYRLKATIKSKQ
jgi:DNA-binding beta-propeller fold protein YncE